MYVQQFILVHVMYRCVYVHCCENSGPVFVLKKRIGLGAWGNMLFLFTGPFAKYSEV